MPQFRFRINDGATDDVAGECANDHAARVEAVRLCARALQRDPEALLWSEDVMVTVYDERNRRLFAVQTSALSGAAPARRAA